MRKSKAPFYLLASVLFQVAYGTTLPSIAPSLSPIFPIATFTPTLSPVLPFENLTETCLLTCNDLRCPGCNLKTGLYIMSSSSDCSSFANCGKFTSNPPTISLDRLQYALQLSYAVVGFSALTLGLLLVDVINGSVSELASACHFFLLIVEMTLSIATLVLLVAEGGFVGYLGSLVSSGCYNVNTAVFLVSLSSNLASATALAIITVLVEALEPFQNVKFCFPREEEDKRDLFFVCLSILALTACIFEAQQLELVVSEVTNFASRFNNLNGELILNAPGSLILDEGLVSNDPCVFYYALPRSVRFSQVLSTSNVSSLTNIDDLISSYISSDDSGTSASCASGVSIDLQEESEKYTLYSVFTAQDVAQVTRCAVSNITATPLVLVRYLEAFGAGEVFYAPQTTGVRSALLSQVASVDCDLQQGLFIRSLSYNLVNNALDCTEPGLSRLDFTFSYQFASLISPFSSTSALFTSNLYSTYFYNQSTRFIDMERRILFSLKQMFFTCHTDLICFSFWGNKLDTLCANAMINSRRTSPVYTVNRDIGFNFTGKIVQQNTGAESYLVITTSPTTSLASYVVHETITGEVLMNVPISLGERSQAGVASGAVLTARAETQNSLCGTAWNTLVKDNGTWFVLDFRTSKLSTLASDTTWGISNGVSSFWEIGRSDAAATKSVLQFRNGPVVSKAVVAPSGVSKTSLLCAFVFMVVLLKE